MGIGCGCILGMFASVMLANDCWPGFRGVDATASSPDARIDAEWSPDHLRWKIEIPGSGSSSPIVWKDRIFLTSAEGPRRLVLALDSATGAILWQHGFELEGQRNHRKNSDATPTPVTDGDRVYAVFTSEEETRLIALDFTGKEVWQRSFGGIVAQHGYGASPILAEGKVIVYRSQDGPSQLFAFDANTGELAWQTETGSVRKAAFCTPLAFEGPTGGQVVVACLGGLMGYRLEDGENLWTSDRLLARPVGSPIRAGELVLACSGDGGKGQNLVAVDPNVPGTLGAEQHRWELKRMVPYVPTPIVVGEQVYFVTDVGVMVCADVATGKVRWQGRLTGNFSASPVLAGQTLFLPGENGKVFAIAADPENFTLLATNDLGESFLATPAITDNRLLLRGDQHLFCIQNPK